MTAAQARTWGTGESLALLSAGAYAGVNVAIRSVAPTVDAFVGSLIRQLPLLVLASTAVLVLRPAEFRFRSSRFLGRTTIATLMATGTISFLIGNVLLFWGFAAVGLSVGAAASQGGLVLAGALLSSAVLREPPSRMQLVGAGAVVAGLVLTAMAASGAAGSTAWQSATGFLAALGAGVCYAIANSVSRQVQLKRSSFVPVLALLNIGGVLALTAYVVTAASGDVGAAFGNLSTAETATLVAAGLINSVAIGSVTLAVRYATVASVSAIAPAVIVLGVITGAVVFGEPVHPLAALGAVVIVAGIAAPHAGTLLSRTSKAPPNALREES